jgi:hypothetical protein
VRRAGRELGGGTVGWHGSCLASGGVVNS